MSRRQFLASAAGVAAVTSMAPEAFARNFIDQYDPDGPIARYPNPYVIVLDERFKYKLGNTPIVRLYRGSAVAVSRRSEFSLHSHDFATFGADEVYNQAHAEGFIRLHSLPSRIAAMKSKTTAGQR